MAGGGPHRGGFGAQYFNTTHGSQGQKGSEVLKPRPTGVNWKAGSTVEVSWAIEANHGGGYQVTFRPSHAASLMCAIA
eukprot:SAG11_NODE_1445_length_4891_cov_8.267738_1_plen_78_part_00